MLYGHEIKRLYYLPALAKGLTFGNATRMNR
jgi:hypothetical protein